MKSKLVISLLSVYMMLNVTLAFSEDIFMTVSKEQEESLSGQELSKAIMEEIRWLQAEKEVTISTRLLTTINKAPSIVTVITAEEIKNSGYRTFVEILRTVPGFAILKELATGDVIPVVRGVEAANKVKVMLNGHTVNTTLNGTAFDRFDDFPVEYIKKIEILRGPGSAMYGENAFLAVINIITFDAKDIDGIKIDSGYGTFDTYETNIVFGRTYGEVDISGMVHYRQTDGLDRNVKTDFQTLLDSFFGTKASLAPGSVDDGRQEVDLNLKVVYKDFWLHGWFSNKRIEPFIGVGLALNDESEIETSYVFGEVGYKKTFEDRLTLKPRVYYDQSDNDSFFEILPEGTTAHSSISIFPDGQLANFKGIERIAGAEIPFDYTLFDENIITLGFEYRLINLSNNHYFANFDQETGNPLSFLENFSESHPFIKDTTRRLTSIYIQDTWDITNTLNLTLGIRHDHYNDFGDATSPRAGLTWLFMENASIKFLYGEAFRAPTFYEMLVVDGGNKNLDPETINTYETELRYRFNRHVVSSLNYFFNDVEDLISLERFDDERQFKNIGSAQVQGIEIETKIDINKGNYIFMNYTFQDTKDNHGKDLPYVAKHKGNIGVNVNYPKYINTNLSAFFSGKRTREPDDQRNDLPSYALVNLSITAKEFFHTMEVQGTVFNIFDKDYSDPGRPVLIPDDLPRPGRTFFVGLSYQF